MPFDAVHGEHVLRFLRALDQPDLDTITAKRRQDRRRRVAELAPRLQTLDVCRAIDAGRLRQLGAVERTVEALPPTLNCVEHRLNPGFELQRRQQLPRGAAQHRRWRRARQAFVAASVDLGAERVGHVTQAVLVPGLAGRRAEGAARALAVVEAAQCLVRRTGLHRRDVGNAQRQRLVPVVDELAAGVFAGDAQRPRRQQCHMALPEAHRRMVAQAAVRPARFGVDGLERGVVGNAEVGNRQRELAARLVAGRALAGSAGSSTGRGLQRIGVAVANAAWRNDVGHRAGRAAVRAKHQRVARLHLAQNWVPLALAISWNR